jgi:hypothetical protein
MGGKKKRENKEKESLHTLTMQMNQRAWSGNVWPDT